MTFPKPLTARLLNYDGTPVADNPLENAFDVDFLDELNGPGTGSCSLSLSQAGATQLFPGRYVDCMSDGVSVFTFKIEGSPAYKSIQQGEEHDQIVTVSGRGWACILDEAIIYPEVGLNIPLDTSWRLFSFASPSFPNAGTWDPAVEVYEYLDGASPPNNTLRGRFQMLGNPPEPYPAPVNFSWPISKNNYDPDDPPGVGYSPTYWIWSEAGASTEEFGIGWCFFRSTFTLASPQIVSFAVTGDNFFTFYLEGVPILGEDADHYMWQGWKEIPIALPAGTYTVAAVAENVAVGIPGEGVDHNPGGFIATVTSNDSDNVPTTAFLVTDSSWDCVFVPVTDKWPGWTPGQIIAPLVSEATGRGSMSVYDSSTFSATLDSNGQPWLPLDPAVNSPYAASFAVEVGTTVLAALGQLVEQGWINWHVRPGTWILDVWRARWPDTPVAAANLVPGGNLTSLERNATEIYANALLVQWAGGFVVVEDPVGIAQHGTRVEDVFSSDATSEFDAIQIGTTELMRRATSGWPSIIAGVEPTSATDCPYLGFQLGDWVTIPNTLGIAEGVRVLSIRGTQDQEGWATWALELNAKLNVPERRRTNLLRQIGGKSQVAGGAVQ